MSWPAIMKTIQEDPTDFFKMGGWSFLTGGDSEDESSDSEAESEFAEESEDAGESSDFSESDG